MVMMLVPTPGIPGIKPLRFSLWGLGPDGTLQNEFHTTKVPQQALAAVPPPQRQPVHQLNDIGVQDYNKSNANSKQCACDEVDLEIASRSC